MNKEKKEIKVINGDGTDLNISPVYEHIKPDSPQNDKKKQNIIIPKGKKDEKSKK